MQFGHEEVDRTDDSVSVGISMLTSYENMGVLEVTCGGGCECKKTLYNTCEPLMHWSPIRWAFQQVKVSTCVLSLLYVKLEAPT